jgi:uncharacterized protein YecE (DUF72 family)
VIWVGTCGFGRRQAKVFRDLHAVEIQHTFYHPVAVELARRWRAAAPSDFLFCVKASQFITHEASSPTYRRARREIPAERAAAYGGFQATPEVEEGWHATRTVADAVQARVILFQCPASFLPTPTGVGALYRFFEGIETSVTKAWEPRGPWPSHIVGKACEDLGLVHAVDPFAAEPATGGLAYFRLHGTPPGRSLYRYSYTDRDLLRLKEICEEYDDAFVMFNNVTMHADAERFLAMTGPPRRA